MAKKAKAAAKKAGTKKPRAAKVTKPGTKAVEQPAPRMASDRKMISENDLMRLLGKGRSAEKELNTLTGTWREEIGNAVKTKHLNKRVFALIRTLDKMEPEALAAWEEDFSDYFEKSGLAKRADSVQRLPMSDGLKADADDGEDGADGAGEGEAPPTVPEAGGEVSKPRLVGGTAAG